MCFKLLNVVVIIILLGITSLSQAKESNNPDRIFNNNSACNRPSAKTADKCTGKFRDEPFINLGQRLVPYKMNYAIYQFTKTDESALEVQYSLKYNFIKEFDEKCNQAHNFFFSYTGMFDFYVGTRSSGPVINRISNPAFHYKFDLVNSENSSIWFDFGLEHKSNGQVTDPNDKDDNPNSPTYGQYITQLEYNKGNRHYFDGISVGSNYVSLSAGANKDNNNLTYGLTYKLYVTSESDVTWGKYAGSGVKLNDFDMINVNMSKTFMFNSVNFKDATLTLAYAIGKKGLSTDSVDIFAILPLYIDSCEWKFPFMVKAHFGPMDRMSDYTKSLSSIGIGFALSY